MSSNRIYSVEEVMNLTAKDLQEPDFPSAVEIQGYKELPLEEQVRCRLKLRELKIQRDELAQSSAVDASILTDKLNGIDRPRSASSSDSFVTPPPLGPEEQREQDWEMEEEWYETLIKNNGRPCYPIELGFDVFDNPGQYKDILEYWQWDKLGKRVFSAQWWEWRTEFRARQQGNRRRYRHSFTQFQEFLRDRRRRHGLDGDLHLCEKVAEQSPLNDWMEYQDYKLQQYEDLEKRLKNAQERLISERKELAEEGYPEFEEIQELGFGEYFGISQEWSEKVGKARKKQELAERKLTIAKKILEATQSEELGERIERDRWIGFFAKEVASRRTTLNELQRAYDETKRDEEPYKQWVDARREEWSARYNKQFDKYELARMTQKEEIPYWKERKRLFELEVETPEYLAKVQTQDELHERVVKASTARNRAEIELEFAEEVLEAARAEDLAPIVERAALIRRTEKEIRFAEFHVEEEEETKKVLGRKWGVLAELYNIPDLKGEMKRFNAVLDWVERERQKMIGDGASAGRESGPRRSTRASSKAATEASRVHHPAKKSARSQKPSAAKSILDPVDPAKVTKTFNKKRNVRRRTMVPRSVSQAAEKTNLDSNTTEPKSNVAVLVEDGIHAHLRPIRASRVSKSTPKRPIGRQNDTTRPSPTRGPSKNVTGRSRNTLVQRSTRGSKRLQSRRPGSK